MNQKQKNPIAVNNQAFQAKPVLTTLSKAEIPSVQTKEITHG